jgi:hypothetical protein
LSRVRLHEALDLPGDGEALLAFQDNASGLHYLRRAHEVRERGLFLRLGAYQYHAFQNWRELRASEEAPWDALCTDLNGSGVWSLDEALAKFKLRPVHAALRRALDADLLRCYSDLAGEGAGGEDAQLVSRASHAPCGREETLAGLTKRGERFFREALASIEDVQTEPVATEVVLGAAVEEKAGTAAAPVDVTVDRLKAAQKTYRSLLEAAARVPELERVCAHTWPPEARAVLPSHSPTVSAASVWSPVAAWCLLRAFEDLLPADRNRGEVFDTLYLRSVLAEVFHPVGLEGDAAHRAAVRVRVLIAQTKDAGTENAGGIAWKDPDVAWLTGLHESDGHRYFNKESHEQMLWWLALPRLVALAGKDAAGRSARTRTALGELEVENDGATKAAKAAGYKLDALLKGSVDAKADEAEDLVVTADVAKASEGLEDADGQEAEPLAEKAGPGPK